MGEWRPAAKLPVKSILMDRFEPRTPRAWASGRGSGDRAKCSLTPQQKNSVSNDLVNYRFHIGRLMA
jgi:hypothetical protein